MSRPRREGDAFSVRTAYDVKAVHRRLADAFRDDELKQITVLPAGFRLEQGARYLDICEGREFTALANQVTERGDCVIAKAEVPYELWNRLRRVMLQVPRSADA